MQVLRTCHSTLCSARAPASVPCAVSAGSTDKSVRVWDVNSGECIRLLLGAKATPRALCFSPDGTVLAAAADDGQVHLWDLASVRGPPRRSLQLRPNLRVRSGRA